MAVILEGNVSIVGGTITTDGGLIGGDTLESLHVEGVTIIDTSADQSAAESAG